MSEFHPESGSDSNPGAFLYDARLLFESRRQANETLLNNGGNSGIYDDTKPDISPQTTDYADGFNDYDDSLVSPYQKDATILHFPSDRHNPKQSDLEANKLKKNYHRGTIASRVLLAAVLTGSVFGAWRSCTGQETAPKPTTSSEECHFEGQQTYVIKDGDGANAIAFQVKGVSPDHCLTEVKYAINEMNPRQNVNAPLTGKVVVIPIKVS